MVTRHHLDITRSDIMVEKMNYNQTSHVTQVINTMFSKQITLCLEMTIISVKEYLTLPLNTNP